MMKSISSLSFRSITRYARVPLTNLPRNFAHSSHPILHSSVAQESGDVEQFKLADIGEGITEVELLQWFVKEGDSIKSFDRICEVQSDKATVEITSRYDGAVHKLHYEVGDIMKVGMPICNIQRSGTKQAKLNQDTEQVAPQHADTITKDEIRNMATPPSFVSSTSQKNVLSTPAVRRLAKENSIDLSTVKGTGPQGRILKEDILALLSGTRAKGQSDISSYSAENSTSKRNRPVTIQSDEAIPIRGIQRKMFQSMTVSKEIPHLTLTDELVVDNLVKLKKDLESLVAERGIKLTYLPFFIKATSLALKEYPILNSSISDDHSSLLYHGQHNIGVAMDTPKGLIVPVIKNVQEKSIMDIALELKELQTLAVEGKLTEAQLTGGTFSLSNIGSICGTYAVPVVVKPQVAIGALGRMQVLPRYSLNGKGVSMSDMDDPSVRISPTTIMNISWSADHRVIDGATVAKFSKLWSKYLETPMLMAAELR